MLQLNHYLRKPYPCGLALVLSTMGSIIECSRRKSLKNMGRRRKIRIIGGIKRNKRKKKMM
jgi:hypothetical protein